MRFPFDRPRRLSAHAAESRRGMSGGRRMRGVALIGVLFSVAVLGLLPRPAEAVYADASGGSGRFERAIDWVEWGANSSLNGFPDSCTPSLTTTTNNSDNPTTAPCVQSGHSMVAWTTPVQVGPGWWRSTRCELRATSGHVMAYVPGSWRGDALARLYNDGRQYSNGVAKAASLPGNFSSGLPIGLANYDYGENGYPTTISFSVTCRAFLMESSAAPALTAATGISAFQEIPLEGIVFADGESNANSKAKGRFEYIAATPIAQSGKSVTWRLLESKASCNSGSYAQRNWSTANTGYYRFQTGGLPYTQDSTHNDATQNECGSIGTTGDVSLDPSSATGYGPSSVLFLQSAQGASFELRGNGRTAVALGVVTFADFGDAPESYGLAGALYQPTWTGGQIDQWAGDLINLSQRASSGLVGSAGNPSVMLGSRIDSEETQEFTPNATGDDLLDGAGSPTTNGSSSDDEDGWTVGEIRTQPGASVTRSVSCSATVTSRVAGWIDWNRNGVFDAAEKSSEAACSGGQAQLTWTVPADVVRSVPGEPGGALTFVRFRIEAGAAGSTMTPTGVTTSGEVEDYALTVRVPTLQLNKVVDNTFAGTSGLEKAAWTLTATGTPIVSGAGAAAETSVTAGSFNLSESATDPRKSAYTAGVWVCKQADGTQGENYSSSVSSTTGTGIGTVTVKNQDRVFCEIVNTAKPATLTWTKVASDDISKLLAGSEWTLTGPSYPSGTAVTDCVATAASACTGLDKDPDSGEFSVTGLIWGEYTLHESKAPVGYVAAADQKVTVTGSSQNLTATFGAVKNTPITGSITWSKVDGDNTSVLLSGSEWTLIPTSTLGTESPAMTITDCTSGTCSGPDTNPTAGAFTLSGIRYGTYTLSETKAPAGYWISEASKAITVTVGAQGQIVTVGPVSNPKQTVPALPLTGGASTDAFLVLGGGALVLAAGASIALGAKRRVRA